MKKAKKLLALISSVVMIASIGAMSVSAGMTESIIVQEYGVVSTMHKNYPVKQTVRTEYKGIIVTMPNGEAPTAEELDIENAEISAYTSNIGFVGLGGSFANGIYMGGSITTPVGSDCTYLINGEDLTEEKAAELIKLWKIRGIVETAEIFYETHINNAEMAVSTDSVDIIIKCNNPTDNEVREREPIDVDKSLYGFSEFAESEFQIESVEIGNSAYYPTSYIRYEVSFEHDKYTENLWSLYEELNKIFDKIEMNYAEDENFDKVDVAWIMPVSDTMSNGLYNVEPIWGDATNDDKVDLYDAIEIAKYIMDISEFDEDTKLLADINRDGVTDLYDAIEIARIIMEESKAE